MDASENLNITISRATGRVPVTILHLDGRINLGTAEQLIAEAEKAIRAGTRYLLLDLAQVYSMSSAGLRALTYIAKSLRFAAAADESRVQSSARSPYLKLLKPAPEVLRVLQIAGYDLFVDILEDEGQAVASF